MSDKHTDWIRANQISGKAVRIDARSDRPVTDWDRKATHWVFTLKREGRGHCDPLVTFYSQGSAHTKPPSTADVLASLVMDAQGAGGSFEDWCADTGYDIDSRKAERLYDQCRSILANIREFLGDEDFASACEVFSDY